MRHYAAWALMIWTTTRGELLVAPGINRPPLRGARTLTRRVWLVSGWGDGSATIVPAYGRAMTLTIAARIAVSRAGAWQGEGASGFYGLTCWARIETQPNQLVARVRLKLIL